MKKVPLKYWIQASRPKTLPVSMAAVILSVALAYLFAEIKWIAAAICLVFAVMAQILSNLANDYADGVKGADSERLGPQRMVASGRISPLKMSRGILIWAILTFLLGCTLLYWGGWILLPLGIVIMLCAIGYSAGPFPLSRHALGDIAVVLFYGIAPVVLTFFIQVGYVNWQIAIAGLSVGVVSDNLLIINNYRDAEQDSKNGKKTTVTMFGKRFMRYVFYLNPIISIVLIYLAFENFIILYYYIPYLAYSIYVSLKFAKSEGEELNKLIAMASFEPVVFALTMIYNILICLNIFS